MTQTGTDAARKPLARIDLATATDEQVVKAYMQARARFFRKDNTDATVGEYMQAARDEQWARQAAAAGK